jgi:hypothetical protein
MHIADQHRVYTESSSTLRKPFNASVELLGLTPCRLSSAGERPKLQKACSTDVHSNIGCRTQSD